ncbi:MAG: oligopeptide/dipeptide ABC transporter ATP-binding protein [Gammaproteobacteria bacterium]
MGSPSVPPLILLAAHAISKCYPTQHAGAGMLRAVDGVSLAIQRGETLGLVGESGCGKSTLARMLALLHRPDAGTIWLDQTNVTHLPQHQLRSFRRRVQMVFQDPFSSLNPRLPLLAILTEPLTLHGIGSRAERRDRAAELLHAVGLDPALLGRYPHEFSGGQRQRIAVARALALEPELVIADEPVSSLDVSVQSQLLNLLVELKQQLGLAYLFISHDLTVVDHIADRVAVMYLGRIVESAPRAILFRAPAHPYTRALIAAIPAIQRGGKRRSGVTIGDVPNSAKPPPGCPYHPRCYKAQGICRERVPEVSAAPDGDGDHQVACHFPEPAQA